MGYSKTLNIAQYNLNTRKRDHKVCSTVSLLKNDSIRRTMSEEKKLVRSMQQVKHG